MNGNTRIAVLNSTVKAEAIHQIADGLHKYRETMNRVQLMRIIREECFQYIRTAKT